MFANGLGDWGSISSRVITKTQNDAALLNTQYYKVRIKGKVEQSRERSSDLLYTSVLYLLKREPSGHPWLRLPILLLLLLTVANFQNNGKIWISCVDKALLSDGGKKILFKQSNGLISVIWTLLHQKRWLRGCMLILNMVVQTQMMLKAQVAQIWQLSQNTKKLHKFVLANCKLKLHEIAEELEISEGSVFTILHEHLSMCSKWVPCLLTIN